MKLPAAESRHRPISKGLAREGDKTVCWAEPNYTIRACFVHMRTPTVLGEGDPDRERETIRHSISKVVVRRGAVGTLGIDDIGRGRHGRSVN